MGLDGSRKDLLGKFLSLLITLFTVCILLPGSLTMVFLVFLLYLPHGLLNDQLLEFQMVGDAQ